MRALLARIIIMKSEEAATYEIEREQGGRVVCPLCKYLACTGCAESGHRSVKVIFTDGRYRQCRCLCCGMIVRAFGPTAEQVKKQKKQNEKAADDVVVGKISRQPRSRKKRK